MSPIVTGIKISKTNFYFLQSTKLLYKSVKAPLLNTKASMCLHIYIHFVNKSFLLNEELLFAK